MTISRNFRVNNNFGLHARPSAQVTRVACGFESEVFISWNGRRANAKSIIRLMMLAVECGATVSVEANGPDEASALAAIGALIDSGFERDRH